MIRWCELKKLEPGIAAVGEKLLYREENGEVAILGTVDKHGRPAMAPVCPIFCADGIYVLIVRTSPKYWHIKNGSRFVIHAMVGADDLEFQVSGAFREVVDEEERQNVLNAIPFPSFDPTDPIVELLFERALATEWQNESPHKLTWKLT